MNLNIIQRVNFRKSILVILSLLMCFFVITTQANTSYKMDYDVASLDDAPKVKSCNDNDQNELAIILSSHSFSPIMILIEMVILDETYRQPNFPLLLRPPII